MLLENLRTLYENGNIYKNINLPISSPHLLSICQKECDNLGIEWCSDEKNISDFIVHRHLHKDQENFRPQ